MYIIDPDNHKSIKVTNLKEALKEANMFKSFQFDDPSEFEVGRTKYWNQVFERLMDLCKTEIEKHLKQEYNCTGTAIFLEDYTGEESCLKAYQNIMFLDMHIQYNEFSNFFKYKFDFK